MTHNAATVTDKFLRLPVGYRFVQRSPLPIFHIRSEGNAVHTLCGLVALMADDDKPIQRAAEVCPTCADALNEKDA